MTTSRDVTRPDAADRTRRSRRPPWRFVAAAAVTIVAVLVTLADRIGGLDRFTPFTQIIAFRPYVVVVVGLLGLIALVATVFRRRFWPFAAGLLAVAVAGAALVVPRMVADPEPPGGRPLTVLAFNVYQGRADLGALTDLIRTQQPELVSLPEGGARFRDRIAPLVAPLGYRAQASSAPDDQDKYGVTVLVSDRLGAVDTTIGTTTDIPYLQVTGGALGTLRFVAMHPRSPLPGAQVALWRSDLAQLAQWCSGPTPAVIAGDLNATLDHSVLRDAITGCGDAATQRGAGLTPTWGPWAGGHVGPQIDHVLATTGIQAQWVRILALPRSDHRALLTRLSLPGPGPVPAQPSSTGSASTP